MCNVETNSTLKAQMWGQIVGSAEQICNLRNL